MNNKSDCKPRFEYAEFAIGSSQNRVFVELSLNKFLILMCSVHMLKLSPISYLSATIQPTDFLPMASKFCISQYSAMS